MSNRTSHCRRALRRRCQPGSPAVSYRITAGKIVMYKFRMGRVIQVPTDVFCTGRGRLVGVEQSAFNQSLRRFGDCYVYTVIEAPADGSVFKGLDAKRADEKPVLVPEDQIAAWKNTYDHPIDQKRPSHS